MPSSPGQPIVCRSANAPAAVPTAAVHSAATNRGEPRNAAAASRTVWALG